MRCPTTNCGQLMTHLITVQAMTHALVLNASSVDTAGIVG
jgi:hypothetical protein